jgi:demethylmenaquinone methyltransferase/2-methoxy-6-polyprenyl-1,4-benzoquinol methylase
LVIEETISADQARSYYDRVGAFYDWAAFYETGAKRLGLEMLQLQPGLRLLNAGCGTGKAHQNFQKAVSPGFAMGIDLSAVMAKMTRKRTGAPVCQGSVGQLPLVSESFDRVYSSYVLDLIPHTLLLQVLAEFRRVLAPGGRVVVITLTEGTTAASRALVALWKAAYSIAPVACGGCRPLQLSNMVETSGFNHINRQVIVQFGVPSEIISAVR